MSQIVKSTHNTEPHGSSAVMTNCGRNWKLVIRVSVIQWVTSQCKVFRLSGYRNTSTKLRTSQQQQVHYRRQYITSTHKMTKVTEIREMAIPPGNVCNTKNRFQRVFLKNSSMFCPKTGLNFSSRFFFFFFFIWQFFGVRINRSISPEVFSLTNVCFVVTGNPWTWSIDAMAKKVETFPGIQGTCVAAATLVVVATVVGRSERAAKKFKSVHSAQIQSFSSRDVTVEQFLWRILKSREIYATK